MKSDTELHVIPAGTDAIDTYKVGKYWDAEVDARASELRERGDPAYRWLCNWVSRVLVDSMQPGSKILDLGCGLGFLTREIARLGFEVDGLDPSLLSVQFATNFNPGPSYVVGTTDCIVHQEQYSAVVANMVLHNSPSFRAQVLDVADLLQPGGLFVATMAHPFTYLAGRPETAKQFDYGIESIFYLPFRIHGLAPHGAVVPFFHRPFSAYYEALRQAGFDVIEIKEPRHVGLGRPNDVATLVARKD